MTAPTDVPEHDIADRMGVAFDLEREAEAAGEEEVAEATPAAEEPEEQPELPETRQVEEPPGEEDEKAEAKPEEEPEPVEEEVAEEPEPAEDEKEISTLEDLAEAFEVEPTELTSHLQVTIGEETIPLSEVIERASAAPLPAQLSEMVGQQREAIEGAETQRQQAFEESEATFLGAVNALLNKAELEGGYSEEAMARLKMEDPEQWAIRSEERRQFYASVDASVKLAREHQQARAQQQAELYQHRSAEEGLKLINAIPEWQDSNLAVWEATLISQSVQDRYGFTPEEMAQMPDHRLALAFRDAHRFHRLLDGAVETKKSLTKKKLTTRKSVMPTRPRRAKGDPQATARAAARKRQRATAGDVRSLRDNEMAAAELLGDHL